MRVILRTRSVDNTGSDKLPFSAKLNLVYIESQGKVGTTSRCPLTLQVPRGININILLTTTIRTHNQEKVIRINKMITKGKML